MRWAILLCAAVTALAAACAHLPPPPLHRARIEVDRSNGGYRPFIRAQVAGQPMKLLIDTGAYHSELPAAFARARHLRTTSAGQNEEMVDANGVHVIAPLLPSVPVQFEGEASAGTMDFFAMPRRGRLEGILAPRDLVRPGWALVLDLQREELSYEPEPDAVKRLSEGASPLREIDFRACVHEGIFNNHHRYVATTIQGTPAKMMIDTGAECTFLTRNNPAIPSMRSMVGERSGVVAMTSVGPGLTVDDVRVEFAGIAFPVSAVVLPVSSACSGGAIGTDVLQHCTIVWGYASMWARCRAPDELP